MIHDEITGEIRDGIREGLDPTDEIEVVGVVRDPTSLIYTPANSTEWTAFIGAHPLTLSGWSNPSHVYNFQDAGPGIQDAAGVINLGAAGSVAYQEAVPGWSRYGARVHAGLAESFSAATMPNANANSVLILTIAQIMSAPASVRSLVIIANTYVAAKLSVTPRMIVDAGGVTVGTGAISPIGVRVIVQRLNRTTGSRDIFTDQEKVTASTGTAQVGQGLIYGGFGTGTTLPHDARYLYSATWYGAAATLSDADIKAMLLAMGFTPPWAASFGTF